MGHAARPSMLRLDSDLLATVVGGADSNLDAGGVLIHPVYNDSVHLKPPGYCLWKGNTTPDNDPVNYARYLGCRRSQPASNR